MIHFVFVFCRELVGFYKMSTAVYCITRPRTEIVSDLKGEVCTISESKVITQNGLVYLRNSINYEIPFEIHNEDDRNFLRVRIFIFCLYKMFNLLVSNTIN